MSIQAVNPSLWGVAEERCSLEAGQTSPIAELFRSYVERFGHFPSFEASERFLNHTFKVAVVAGYGLFALFYAHDAFDNFQSAHENIPSDALLTSKSAQLKKEGSLSAAYSVAFLFGLASWLDQFEWVRFGRAVGSFNAFSSLIYTATAGVKIVDAWADLKAAESGVEAACNAGEKKKEEGYRTLALLRLAINVSSIAASALELGVLSGVVAAESPIIITALALYGIFAAAAYMQKRGLEARDGKRPLAYA